MPLVAGLFALTLLMCTLASAVSINKVTRIDPVTGIRPDVDLTNLDGPRSVSRRHAKIVRLEGEFQVVEEIGTMNGTFVNGKRIATGSPMTLHDGDRLPAMGCPFVVEGLPLHNDRKRDRVLLRHVLFCLSNIGVQA